MNLWVYQGMQSVHKQPWLEFESCSFSVTINIILSAHIGDNVVGRKEP